MSYASGTIADASTYSVTLMDTFKTAITTQGAWTFIEQRASGTKKTDVYKCSGASNSLGADFYVGICRSADTGVVGFVVAEGYDLTNHKFQKVGPLLGAVSYSTENASGYYATDRNPYDTSLATSFGAGGLVAVGHGSTVGGVAPANGSPYVISVTNDRILAQWATTGGAYVGLYDSFYSSTVDPVPLVAVPLSVAQQAGSGSFTSILQTQNPAGGAFTRELGLPSGYVLPTAAFSAYIDSMLFAVPGSGGTTLIQVDAVTGTWWPSRLRLSQGSRRCVQRGLLKDVVGMMQADVSEALGDTAAIGGVTYNLAYPAYTTSPFVASNQVSIWVNPGV
jgi:hypothetical protein